MAKAKTPEKPRNPQDATLRNVRAANKRLDNIGENQIRFVATQNDLKQRVAALEEGLAKVTTRLDMMTTRLASYLAG